MRLVHLKVSHCKCFTLLILTFQVSGGPYGVEDAVKNGGPLLAILGFIVFALVGNHNEINFHVSLFLYITLFYFFS